MQTPHPKANAQSQGAERTPTVQHGNTATCGHDTGVLASRHGAGLQASHQGSTLLLLLTSSRVTKGSSCQPQPPGHVHDRHQAPTTSQSPTPHKCVLAIAKRWHSTGTAHLKHPCWGVRGETVPSVLQLCAVVGHTAPTTISKGSSVQHPGVGGTKPCQCSSHPMFRALTWRTDSTVACMRHLGDLTPS